MMNEQELIKRCIKGDGRALATFYDNYAPLLLGACLRYVTIRSDAEDLLQEAFIKILQNLPRFEYRGEGALLAWMKRIIVNLALNFLRKREKNLLINEQILSVEDEKSRFEEDDPGELTPEEIHRLIGELPVGYRTVLNLFVFEKYSHSEIAELLGCSESNSKSQLLRARALLKKNMMILISNKEYIPVYGKQ